PFGLVAVYYYTLHREQVWNLEIVIVQGIACLPGAGIGLLLKRVLLTPSSGDRHDTIPAEWANLPIAARQGAALDVASRRGCPPRMGGDYPQTNHRRSRP